MDLTDWIFVIAVLFVGSPIWGAVLAKPLKARGALLGMMALFAFLGGAIGTCTSFCVVWQRSPTLRYRGFPFPAFIWQLENGKWVDYVGSPLTAVMNVTLFAGAGAFLVFCWIAFLRMRLSRKSGL
jgi:hypothetical protein